MKKVLHHLIKFFLFRPARALLCASSDFSSSTGKRIVENSSDWRGALLCVEEWLKEMEGKHGILDVDVVTHNIGTKNEYDCIALTTKNDFGEPNVGK